MKGTLTLLTSLFFLLLSGTHCLAQSLVWAKGMGGQNADYAYGVATDASDNVFSTGTFTGLCDFDPGPADNSLITSGNTDGFVSKLNASGAYVWAKSFTATSGGICQPAAIAADAAGNTYVTGYWHGTVDFDPSATSSTLNNGGTNEDIFIVKLNASGALVWYKSIGNNSNDFGTGIVVDASGNIYVTGHFNLTVDFDPSANTANLTPVGAQDVFILKLDASGNYVWARNVGGTNTDYGRAITVDGAGNVYTTGSFLGTGDFNPGAGTTNTVSAGFGDAFISKLDASGNFVWAKALGGASADAGYGIAVDANGNVITAGIFTTSIDLDPGAATVTSNGFASYDIFISKLDASGNYVWGKVMGGTSGDDLVQGLSLDAAGNIYTTGSFRGQVDFDPGAGVANLFPGGAFMSKLNANGTYGGAVQAGSVGYGINISTSGKVHVAGNFSGTSDFNPSAATSNLTSVLSSNDIFVWKLSRCAPITSSASAAICQGATYNFNGQNLSTAGTYTTTYTSSGGCDSVVTLNLTLNVSPSAAITGTNTICVGASTTLTASGGNAYVWSNGTTLAGNTVSPTANATYLVTVTNASGCTATASRAVTVNTPTSVTVNPSNGQITCASPSSVLSVSSGSSFAWSNNATSQNITVTAAGNYIVTVTNANGCTSTANASVTRDVTVPSVSISTPTLITCMNRNTTVTATGAASYSWSNGVNIASNVISNAGTYIVTGTGANGCTATSNVLINANTNAPTIAIASPSPLTCTNLNSTLTATGGDSYVWSNGQNTSNSISVNATGTYSVTGTNAANGCTASTSAIVTSNTTAPTVTISGNALLTCANTSVSLTANGGSSYMWSGNVNNASLSVTTAGTYTVTGTNAANGCTATTSAVVTSNTTAPTVTISGNALLTCANTSVNLTANGGSSYLWSGNVNNASLSVTTAGTYTVTGTNAANGCTAVASVTVSQNTTPPTATTPVLNNGILEAFSGNTSYQWYIGSNPIPGASNSVFTPTITGSYSYQTTISSNGCTATSTALQVTISGIESLENIGVKLYPNPTTSVLFVESLEAVEFIQVIDQMGKVIAVQGNPSALDVSNLSSGIYFVKITLQNGQVGVSKVIKL